MGMGDKDFVCAKCGGVFEKTRPDGEAMAEKEMHWPEVPMEHCVMVCDDCYRLMVQ